MFRAALLVAPAMSGLAFAQASAQAKVPQPIQDQPDVKTPRLADPVKGYGEVTAVTPEAVSTVRKPHVEGPLAQQMLAQGPATIELDRVYYDVPGDGRTWASGATFKASFGRDGFTYVPFLGATAPRNYPVRFALDRVEVGGHDLAFDGAAPAVRHGDRIVFDRGAVQEVYDLTPRGIEQTFVVDGALPGDVVVDICVVTDLVEDAAAPGLQFRNALGGVEYGTAYVVHGDTKRTIGSAFRDGAIRLQVPAAQRTSGKVVIDPVISTASTGVTSSADFAKPDIAFDASTLHYMMVWQRNFSATDIDIWSEMRDVGGGVISGSMTLIDNTTAHWSKPRVANLNLHDRFLVVAERLFPANPIGQQYEVWGKTQNAGSPYVQSSQFEISGEQGGDKRQPDVGGDPNGVAPTFWTVVYTRELSPTDHDIHARQVEEDTTLRSVVFIENSSNTVHRDPQISQSNGLVASAAQRWLIVYGYKFSSTDWDVYGATMKWDGPIGQGSTAIETSSRSDRSPGVSSATSAVAGSPTFAVTFATEAMPLNIMAKVVGGTMNTVVPTTNLSSLLGIGQTNAYFPHLETDGSRFALTYATLPAWAATLGVLGGAFVVHEAPQMIGNGTNAFDLNIAASGPAGGPNTGYAIVFQDTNATPDRVLIAAYEGHGAGGFFVLATGCNGLGIQATGRPLLGRTCTAALTGVGSDLVGMIIGLPLPALTVCPGCHLGVNLSGPTFNLPNFATVNLPIPNLHNLVGSRLAVQGYAVGSGTCLGSVRLGDTLDITIQ